MRKVYPTHGPVFKLNLKKSSTILTLPRDSKSP